MTPPKNNINDNQGILSNPSKNNQGNSAKNFDNNPEVLTNPPPDPELISDDLTRAISWEASRLSAKSRRQALSLSDAKVLKIMVSSHRELKQEEREQRKVDAVGNLSDQDLIDLFISVFPKLSPEVRTQIFNTLVSAPEVKALLDE